MHARRTDSSSGWEPVLLAKFLVEFLKRSNPSFVRILQSLANCCQGFLPSLVRMVLNLPKVEGIGGCERNAAVCELLVDEGPEGLNVISAFGRHGRTPFGSILL